MPRTAEAEPTTAQQVPQVAEDAFERDENGDGDEDEEDDEDIDMTDDQESDERSANVAMTTTTTTTTESVEEVVRGKNRLCPLFFLHLFHPRVVLLQTFKLYVVQEIPRVMSYMRHLVFLFARAHVPQRCVGPRLSQAPVVPCWSAGTSIPRSAVVFPSCLGDVEGTGITLSRRSTAWLSAAVRVSSRTGARRCPH